jgi:hypothetical protein
LRHRKATPHLEYAHQIGAERKDDADAGEPLLAGFSILADELEVAEQGLDALPPVPGRD